MEEVTVHYLGKDASLRPEHFHNLTTFVTQDDLLCLRLPSNLEMFNPEIDVLHSCLYYLLTVSHNIFHCQDSSFKERCLQAVSQHYLRKGMNFELYEYGFLCSQLLTLPLEKCLHAIYYLVYARLASRPFIQQIISQSDPKQLTRTSSPKSTKLSKHSSKHSSKLNKKTKLTMASIDSELEMDSFQLELRKTLTPAPTARKAKKTHHKINNYNVSQETENKGIG